ncbi:glycosyl transferase [Aureococcus anophagefferens]|nr:glycosyl transferase [Aureococcus anophagefferens]
MGREFVALGGDGVISVTANVAPRDMQTMLANPNKSSSIKIDAKLRALHEKLFVQANPIPVKWALHRAGRMGAGIRSRSPRSSPSRARRRPRRREGRGPGGAGGEEPRRGAVARGAAAAAARNSSRCAGMADAGGLFGLLSIFKNEAHIMAEWIDHYVAEGVDKFYLIDNGSTDDYMPILTPHIVSGLVVLVKDAKRHAQVEHYNKHFHSVITKECAWVMTVDFDEFLYARKPHATTKAYLATLPAAIHQSYASPVLKHCKSIARAANIGQLNTHEVYFNEEWVWHHRVCRVADALPCLYKLSLLARLYIKRAHVAGHDVLPDMSAPSYGLTYPQQALTETLLENSALHCNHYFIQSKQWYGDVKMTRGDVTIKSADHAYRTWWFFDQNDVKDVVDTELKDKAAARAKAAQ